MRNWVRGLVIVVAVLASRVPVHAANFLEMNRACDGQLLSKSERFEIVGWDGDSRRALGKRVYEFGVRCDDHERDIIDLFLAAERSDRYKREGNTLMWKRRTERRSVKTKDAGCEQVPKRVEVSPSAGEAREACRHQPMPMACEIDVMAQTRMETRMVEECWRARFETREVPIWESYPEGHAPLPRGARIVKVATRGAGGSQPSGGGAVTPPTNSTQGGGTSPFMLLLVAALAVAGTVIYFQRKTSREGLREETASARSQMGGGAHSSDYGSAFRSEDFGSSGFEGQHSSTSGSYGGYSEQTSEPPRQEEPRSENDIPTTLEDACRLLNVTPDTPHDEVNRIYKAMAMAWHVDRSTNEHERDLRDAKMKQLNAAKDIILGRR